MKLTYVLIAAAASLFAPLAQAQDAARGARLFADTPTITGKPVAACVSCHGNVRVLREMIANRGGRPDDVRALSRWLGAVFSGAQPGSANAKSQYRNMLTATDLRDLAAYIARTAQAATSARTVAGDLGARSGGS